MDTIDIDLLPELEFEPAIANTRTGEAVLETYLWGAMIHFCYP